MTRAGRYLAQLLELNASPVLRKYDLFRIVSRMYKESSDRKLYLRRHTPSPKDYVRLRLNLKKAGMIGTDPDYGPPVIRVLTVPDLPAEDIVCLLDPTCYVSHLSAMQRWALTDRSPNSLGLTRPTRASAAAQLRAHMTETLDDDQAIPYPLTILGHPARVRRRPIRIFESNTAGAFIQSRGEAVRLATIGQTFLDMLQKPSLCGGMPHILDVWEEYAATYLEDIVPSVETARSGLVKSRAGYILEERLGLRHRGIERWKAYGQRGSSRRLDPAREFAPSISDTWMISLNV